MPALGCFEVPIIRGSEVRTFLGQAVLGHVSKVVVAVDVIPRSRGAKIATSIKPLIMMIPTTDKGFVSNPLSTRYHSGPSSRSNLFCSFRYPAPMDTGMDAFAGFGAGVVVIVYISLTVT